MKKIVRPFDETGVLIVGAGHFGKRAAAVIREDHPDRRIVMTDREDRSGSIDAPGVEFVQSDAVSVLDKFLDDRPEWWIVPAVPIHLLYVWLMLRPPGGRKAERIPVPVDLPVPNPFPGENGDLYVSFATFLCPDNCPEPEGTCTVTGEERLVPLFQLLADLEVPGHKVLGLRSHQLGPGAGGYLGTSLLELRETVLSSDGPLLIYTACRCHGVISGMRWV